MTLEKPGETRSEKDLLDLIQNGIRMRAKIEDLEIEIARLNGLLKDWESAIYATLDTWGPGATPGVAVIVNDILRKLRR